MFISAKNVRVMRGDLHAFKMLEVLLHAGVNQSSFLDSRISDHYDLTSVSSLTSRPKATSHCSPLSITTIANVSKRYDSGWHSRCSRILAARRSASDVSGSSVKIWPTREHRDFNRTSTAPVDGDPRDY